MINKMLKLAGVKDEKSFYKKYPNEDAFMKEHGEAFNKLVNGGNLKKQANASSLILDYGANGIEIDPTQPIDISKFNYKPPTEDVVPELNFNQAPKQAINQVTPTFNPIGGMGQFGDEATAPSPIQPQDGNVLNAQAVGGKPQKKKTDWGKTIAGGLAAIDMMMPSEQIKLNRPNPANAPYYNPNPSGTGTSAMMEMGGGLPGASGMFYARGGGDFQPKSMLAGGSMTTFDQGGELQLYSPDSKAAQISPSIVKFQGKEHGESNAIGSEGIPLQYGDNPVEVENDETGYTTQDGGFTVLGKMKNPLSGRMFKNDGKVLATKETKVSKQLAKGADLMDSSDTQNPFELLKFNSGKAKTIGAKYKSDAITKEKETLAALQQHMLDFAEQNNLDPNAMSKGKIKKGKYGINIPTAENGTKVKKNLPPIKLPNFKAPTENLDFTAPEFDYKPIGNDNGIDKQGISQTPLFSPQGGIDSVPQEAPKPGVTFGDTPPLAPMKNDIMFKGADWKNYVKPAFVLATNHKQPVRMATLPTPALEQTYQNEVDLNPLVANSRALQQSIGGNAAEAATATAIANQQLYQAQGQGFASNQERAAGTYNRNRAVMNEHAKDQANLTQTQADRQAQMEANTRTMTRDALGQISEIDLENKRDWNNFNVQKQLFPTFGVDPNNQLKVENPYNFNVPQGAISDGRNGFVDSDGNKIVVKQKYNPYGVSTGKEVTTTAGGRKSKGKYGISINREFKSYKP